MAISVDLARSAGRGQDPSDHAHYVANRINGLRTANGVPSLIVNPALTTAAQSHVRDMVSHQHHSHTGTDGSTVRVRIERTGYGPGNRSGENWVSVADPAQAIDWWLNSAAHRRNIFNPVWEHLGIGVAINQVNGQYYVVAVFAAPGDSYSSPSSTVPAAIQKTPSITGLSPVTYRVQPGDTLSSIALKFGVSWQSIATVNALEENSILSIGQTLKLNAAASGSSGTALTGINYQAYAIQEGDTLFTVASRYQINWQALAVLNGLSERDLLRIGQVIQVPSNQQQLSTLNNVALSQSYKVRPGDTIISIAERFKLDWQELLRLNRMADSSLLRIGQVIRLK